MGNLFTAYRNVEIERLWIVGRDPCCDVVIRNEYIGATNTAVCRYVDGEFAVADLGSTNGTYVQRTPYDPAAGHEVLGARSNPRIAVTRPTHFEPGHTLWIGWRQPIPWAAS